MLENYPEGDRSRSLTIDNILAYEYEGIASMLFADLVYSSFYQVCYIIFETFSDRPKEIPSYQYKSHFHTKIGTLYPCCSDNQS
jgi:hypothetical protein